jgi:hypothetical protein
MPVKIVLIAFAVLLSGLLLSAPADCSASDQTVPRVISTSPANGAPNVDPKLAEISVTFSRPMMDKSWSWCYEDKNKFPQIIGQPKYMDNFTKNIITVKLEPNKEYVIWINTSKIKNFKDKTGTPAVPYKLIFKTGK